MISLLTDDARINSIVFGTYIGKDGATEYWQLLYNVFPDIKINPVTITADENGNRIVVTKKSDSTFENNHHLQIEMVTAYLTAFHQVHHL